MITVKEISSKKDLKTFVKFPFQLYKENPYWVPPIIKDELEGFDRTKNPVFEHANAWYFLAYKNEQLVGRVVAIINWSEVNDQNIKKMRFGWFDFVDDLEVSQALLEKVKEIGLRNKLEYMEGPVGFSNLDKVGVLTEGFNELGSMITWYNEPYYEKHYEHLGFSIEKEYYQQRFPFSNADPAKFEKANTIIKKRYGLKEMNFSSSSEIMPYVDQMFDLFNITYSQLASFVRISDVQKEYFKKKYISFINPEYIKFVADKENNLVAFAIVMPSFSKALQKAKGKLFPFGVFHLLKARKTSKEAIFYLIGIHPEYQNKGLIAIIFNEFYKVFEKNGIEMCYPTPQLEENTAIRQIWKHFDPDTYKRRKTYKKDLS